MKFDTKGCKKVNEHIEEYYCPNFDKSYSLKKEMGDWFRLTSEAGFEDAFMEWSGNEDYRNYTRDEIESYRQKAKDLLFILTPKSSLEKWLIKHINEGYGLGYSFYNKKIYAFKELKVTEKVYWECTEYMDIMYSQDEIPTTFDMISDKYEIDLYDYLINEEELLYTLNKHTVREWVEQDNNRAIAKVEELLEKINKEDRVQGYLELRVEQVLKECIRIWGKGGRIAYRVK